MTWRILEQTGRAGSCLLFFSAVLTIASLLLFSTAETMKAATPEEKSDEMVALELAEFLRSARTVISQWQPVINDPARGDKGLTPERTVEEAKAIYQKRTGQDPEATDPQTKEGKLLRAQMDAIRDVMSENQNSINGQGTGFKGFIPALFSRMVNEKFEARAGDIAKMKVTAPEHLVRFRKARPDAWEKLVLTEKFDTGTWKKGEPFSEVTTVDGRQAFRLLVPDYYVSSCLTCHGGPKGEMDITGYPKEGGHEGDLGGAISITLYQ
ncbi:hypothetical protein FHS85_002567 [Rhodoligotrophos appendicifer]|uniref:Tll0287-like domain-containing protein n=1 Tax=Rhodoligotrophos appendicifer TaxID=987056 RepID=UPI001FE3DC86|nr:DUF3365 domain-containing protein [Rhodoligotrophos appendicifer]